MVGLKSLHTFFRNLKNIVCEKLQADSIKKQLHKPPVNVQNLVLSKNILKI